MTDLDAAIRATDERHEREHRRLELIVLAFCIASLIADAWLLWGTWEHLHAPSPL